MANLRNKIVEFTLNDKVLHLMFLEDDGFRIYTKEHESYVFLDKKTKLGIGKFEETDDGFVASRGNFKFVYFNDGSFKVYIKDTLRVDAKISFDQSFETIDASLKEKEGHKNDQNHDYKFLITSKLNEEDNYYGLGDKTGFLNKKFYEYINYNDDNPSVHAENLKSLYKSINLFYIMNQNSAIAVFLDNTYKSIFNFGTDLKTTYYGSVDGELDVYYYIDNSIKNLISRVTKDLGRNDVPPLKALGNQQSRWSYNNKWEVESVIDGYNKYDIPLDIVHLDIDYMEGYRDFTISNSRYPDFENWLKWLKNTQNIGIVTIIDAGVKLDPGYLIYEEGVKNNYFAKLNKKDYVNEVWPGESVFPNFNKSTVRDWWSQHCKTLKEMGVVGIWNDMNEPASFNGPIPDNVEFRDDNNKIHYHKEIHNVYGHLMSKATCDGIEMTGLRPFVITRAAFMGTNRYSSIWTGDNHSIYSHLQLSIPQLINLGLCGFSFAGTDVGGFSYDCTKELLIRWIEAGFLSPLLRNHSALATRPQEPYQYDEETAKIYKKYVDLRYTLLPYLYDCFYEHYLTGLPVMRPLFIDYQDDKNTYNLNGEFMIGDNLLLAPVVEQGSRHKVVYLPKGRWFDFFTKKHYKGGCFYTFEVGIDEVKLFVKNNTIIPTFDRFNRIQNKYDHITFNLYGYKGSYKNYLDDYNTLSYKYGNYNVIKVDVEYDNVAISKEGNAKFDYSSIDVYDVLNKKML